jgi:hypothetical protein
MKLERASEYRLLAWVILCAGVLTVHAEEKTSADAVRAAQPTAGNTNVAVVSTNAVPDKTSVNRAPRGAARPRLFWMRHASK